MSFAVKPLVECKTDVFLYVNGFTFCLQQVQNNVFSCNSAYSAKYSISNLAAR